ncbi:unnamed protein product, partial [Polarella glacialis]
AQNSALPGSALRSCVTPSAACTDGQVREWVERQFALQGGQAWTQVAGESTFDLSDDSFAVNPSLDDNFQLGLKSANEMVLDEAIELPSNYQEPTWHKMLTSPEIAVPVAVVFVLLGMG